MIGCGNSLAEIRKVSQEKEAAAADRAAVFSGQISIARGLVMLRRLCRFAAVRTMIRF